MIRLNHFHFLKKVSFFRNGLVKACPYNALRSFTAVKPRDGSWQDNTTNLQTEEQNKQRNVSAILPNKDRFQQSFKTRQKVLKRVWKERRQTFAVDDVRSLFDSFLASKKVESATSEFSVRQSELLNTLKDLSLNELSDSLSIEEMNEIIDSLYKNGGDERVLQVMNQWGALNGKWNFTTNIQKEFIRQILNKINTEAILHSPSLCQDYLLALASIQIPWKEVPKSFRVQLICSVINFSKEEQYFKDCVSMVNSFGKLTVMFQDGKDLPENVREAYRNFVKQAIDSIGKRFYNPKDKLAASILMQLDPIGLKRNGLKEGQILSIYDGLHSEWSFLSNREMAFALYHLSQLPVTYEEIPSSLAEFLFSRLARKLGSARLKVTSTLMHAMTDLAAPWYNLPNWFHEEVFQAVNHSIQNDCLQGKTNHLPLERECTFLLFNMGKLEIKWTDLPDELKQNIFNSLGNMTSTFAARGLADSLLGVGWMGLKWSNLPLNLQTDLLKRIAILLESPLNSISISGLLRSFQLLQYDWTQNLSLYEQLFLQLERNLLQDSEHGTLSSILKSLSNSNLLWQSLPSSVQSSFLKTFNLYLTSSTFVPQEVVDLLQGFVNLEATKEDFQLMNSEIIQDTLQKVAPQVNPLAALRLLKSIASLGYSWEDLNPKTRDDLIIMVLRTHEGLSSVQLLSELMHSIALLNFDCDHFESQFQMHVKLIEQYLKLESKTLIASADNLEDQYEKQILDFLPAAIYFEWLETLPETNRVKLLESIKMKNFPVRKVSPKPSSMQVFTQLQAEWRTTHDLRTEQKKNLQLLNNYSGLKRLVFPMLAVQWNKQEILAFIEISNRFDSFNEKNREEIQLSRKDKLKAYLYHQAFPDVPIWRFAGSEAPLRCKQIVKRLVPLVKTKLKNDQQSK